MSEAYYEIYRTEHGGYQYFIRVDGQDYYNSWAHVFKGSAIRAAKKAIRRKQREGFVAEGVVK